MRRYYRRTNNKTMIKIVAALVIVAMIVGLVYYISNRPDLAVDLLGRDIKSDNIVVGSDDTIDVKVNRRDYNYEVRTLCDFNLTVDDKPMVLKAGSVVTKLFDIDKTSKQLKLKSGEQDIGSLFNGLYPNKEIKLDVYSLEAEGDMFDLVITSNSSEDQHIPFSLAIPAIYGVDLPDRIEF